MRGIWRVGMMAWGVWEKASWMFDAWSWFHQVILWL